MAYVVVTQENDGVPSGEPVEVAAAFNGEVSTEILERKAATHQAAGWTVQRDADGFHAWKLYDALGGISRKDRYYRVV